MVSVLDIFVPPQMSLYRGSKLCNQMYLHHRQVVLSEVETLARLVL